MDKEKMDKLFEKAKENTKYNSQGQTVINKNDEWVKETEWDKMYNKSLTPEQIS